MPSPDISMAFITPSAGIRPLATKAPSSSSTKQSKRQWLSTNRVQVHSAVASLIGGLSDRFDTIFHQMIPVDERHFCWPIFCWPRRGPTKGPTNVPTNSPALGDWPRTLATEIMRESLEIQDVFGRPGTSANGGGLEMVPRGGIEPPTRGFSVRCSTD